MCKGCTEDFRLGCCNTLNPTANAVIIATDKGVATMNNFTQTIMITSIRGGLS